MNTVLDAMQDLRDVDCELLTITQYLRPSPRHHPVSGWVRPRRVRRARSRGRAAGFRGVMSGPLVRSAYRPGRLCGRPAK